MRESIQINVHVYDRFMNVTNCHSFTLAFAQSSVVIMAD